ncbi:helix-turn-helix transcriptional regulator [uncultured Ruminococcus sp.]|uniref:helix-turn-helix domain-containing protein n=1 Tax=uncultured Ruminococcus sp. TaxID=165186 RepID=UPI0025F35990|nr:helix-turn-helix transcriptional regulator [uncultured Ruminococcus sp.]
MLSIRKARGFTREQLAEKADISVQFLADIEKGRKNMAVTTLRKLSTALMVSADYIVNGTEKKENELSEIGKTLSPKRQKQTAELLRMFIDALDDN